MTSQPHQRALVELKETLEGLDKLHDFIHSKLYAELPEEVRLGIRRRETAWSLLADALMDRLVRLERMKPAQPFKSEAGYVEHNPDAGTGRRARPMNETKRETNHKPEDDHGKAVEPYRVIPPDAGWTVCPENAGKYTGNNQPWRE